MNATHQRGTADERTMYLYGVPNDCSATPDDAKCSGTVGRGEGGGLEGVFHDAISVNVCFPRTAESSATHFGLISRK